MGSMSIHPVIDHQAFGLVPAGYTTGGQGGGPLILEQFGQDSLLGPVSLEVHNFAKNTVNAQLKFQVSKDNGVLDAWTDVTNVGSVSIACIPGGMQVVTAMIGRGYARLIGQGNGLCSVYLVKATKAGTDKLDTRTY